jgi:hypothetical protein
MAHTQKLKVFRTPIGFHDAYVAAPSQKAALEAWGSDANLFARGAAERIDDPELMREPLANPGRVIRRPRGTMAEHMAALPKDKARKKSVDRPANRSTASARKPKPGVRKPPPKPKPRPDRQPLTEVEEELAAIETRHDRERAELDRKQAELDRERRTLERDQTREREKAERRIGAARAKYDRAMRAWRAD